MTEVMATNGRRINPARGVWAVVLFASRTSEHSRLTHTPRGFKGVWGIRTASIQRYFLNFEVMTIRQSPKRTANGVIIKFGWIEFGIDR